ncbi:MAG: phosphatase PAP2 family protein [Fibrobacteres bacterium]|nr:phosphatase PAP2 family protein [Fibrobacterota bacterium]
MKRTIVSFMLLFAAMSAADSTYNIDQKAFLKINGCRNKVFDIVSPGISNLPAIPGFLYLYSAGYGLYRDDKEALDFATIGVVSASATVLANQTIKLFVKRERPIFALPEAQGSYSHGITVKIFPSEQYSFPSQSASLAMSTAVVYGTAYPKYDWIFYSLAIVNGWSRIYRGAHYPGDVLAGEMLGALTTFGTLYAMRKLDDRYDIRKHNLQVPLFTVRRSF